MFKALVPCALAVSLLFGAPTVSAQRATLRVVKYVKALLQNPHYQPPPGVTWKTSPNFMGQPENWVRVTVRTKRGRTQKKLYVCRGDRKPLFGLSASTLVEYENGTVVAYTATTGAKPAVATSRTRGSLITTTVRQDV